jgi:uncharacterized protein
MLIDCHVHLLPTKVREDRTPFCESDPAFGILYRSEKAKLASGTDIIDYLDRSGIDKAVVFGFPWADPELITRNNDEMWEFHQRHPDRIIPFAVLSPHGGKNAFDEAQRTVQGGFSGFGELAVYAGGWTKEGFDSLAPVFELASSAGVPVLVHINEPVGHLYPGKVHVDFSALVEILRAYPGLDVILAHLGGGIFVYGLMPEIRGVFARTYVDTAAAPFLYDSRIYNVVAQIMGPDKIVFGSDYPLLPLSRYLKHLDQAGIDADARAGILGRNMERLLLKTEQKGPETSRKGNRSPGAERH